jgi:uncharacterized protein YbjT (DUF2867 family)
MTPPIVVTAPTGNVGTFVVEELLRAGAPVRAALRPGQRVRTPTGTAAGLLTEVEFDFTEPSTWEATFQGATTVFLVRPPALSNVTRDLLPSMAAARDAGVQHVVFLSLQGAEKNALVPHHDVETWLQRSGMSWTFVRASFFMQNMSTTHAADIRDRDEISVPAGGGRTAFVDAKDVAAVAAVALREPADHRNVSWTPTGPEALTYDEVATVLSDVLGRPIRYTRPGLTRYVADARRDLGMAWGFALVTGAIYTAARLGQAGGLTDDVRTVTGRDPIPLREFAEREKSVWSR